MSNSPTPKLSVSLALSALQEASEEVWACESALAEARRVRDELLTDAIQHVAVTRLSLITKLSRQSIYKIAPGKLRRGD